MRLFRGDSLLLSFCLLLNRLSPSRATPLPTPTRTLSWPCISRNTLPSRCGILQYLQSTWDTITSQVKFDKVYIETYEAGNLPMTNCLTR